MSEEEQGKEIIKAEEAEKQKQPEDKILMFVKQNFVGIVIIAFIVLVALTLFGAI